MAAEIQKGYVFLARDILKSTLWQRRPEDRVVALTSIVLANHQPATWHDGHHDVQFSRGQFARSWGGLARACNLTLKNVRTSVERLETAKFLARKGTTYYSTFSVLNYGRYQDRDRYGREKDMPEGAILVARQILESSLWEMSAQDRVVGITCLLIANHTSGSIEVGGESIHLDRGQFHASWDRLAKACRLTVEQTQESIARLITSEFLVRDRLTSTVFTIPKYNHYQDPAKYAESGTRPLSELQATLFDLLELSARAEPARRRQRQGKEAAGTRQGGGKEAATDKNNKNSKNGEEGGRTSPTPDLFGTETRGAPPPLPPGAQRIAEEYVLRFPGIMGIPKALNQAVTFLGRGGHAEEALKAIREETRAGVVIWKILDPLLEKKDDWRKTFVPPKEWLSEEPAQPGAT